jgi:hypothetical protein
VASKLVLIDENGAARPVDAAALPGLIADAHDDAEALAALVEMALDLAATPGGAHALLATSPAIARLRALDSPRTAELAAQAGIALVAARDIDVNAGLAGAPVRMPMWADLIAGASSFLPRALPTSAKLPRVAIFAFSDETASSPTASAAAPTIAGALTRGVPLALAERLIPYAECVVTAPVVESKGFYVAKRAWALPEALALSPLSEHDATHVVTGRVTSIEPSAFAVEIDIWDLQEGVLQARVYEHGDVHAVIAALVLAVAEVLSGRKRSAKKRLPPRPTRETRDDLFPARETRAHLEGLAHRHAMLLAAAGLIDGRELMNVDVALAALRDLARDDTSLRAQLGFAAFVVAAVAAGMKIDQSVRDEARTVTDRVRTAGMD